MIFIVLSIFLCVRQRRQHAVRCESSSICGNVAGSLRQSRLCVTGRCIRIIKLTPLQRLRSVQPASGDAVRGIRFTVQPTHRMAESICAQCGRAVVPEKSRRSRINRLPEKVLLQPQRTMVSLPPKRVQRFARQARRGTRHARCAVRRMSGNNHICLTGRHRQQDETEGKRTSSIPARSALKTVSAGASLAPLEGASLPSSGTWRSDIFNFVGGKYRRARQHLH